jgi:hypothetical protein
MAWGRNATPRDSSITPQKHVLLVCSIGFVSVQLGLEDQTEDKKHHN